MTFRIFSKNFQLNGIQECKKLNFDLEESNTLISVENMIPMAESDHIPFYWESFSIINCQKIDAKSVQNLLSNKPGNQGKLSIFDSFNTSPGSIFDISSFVDNFIDISIGQPFVPLIVPNFIDSRNTKYFALSNVDVRERIDIVFNSEVLAALFWQNKELSFCPRFYSGRDGKPITDIWLSCATFFEKEILTYSKVEAVEIGLPERIEYGSLANSLIVRKIIHKENEAYEMSLEDKQKFLDGKCWELIPELCEICLMHQYGLHRFKHNVPSKCRAKTELDTNKMKTCYWRPVQPAPKTVAEKLTPTNYLQDDSIKVCDELEDDITEYLSKLAEFERSAGEMLGAKTFIHSLATFIFFSLR